MNALKNPPEREALTVPEAAAALGIGLRTLKRHIANGEVQTTKIGGRRLVPLAALRQRLAVPA